MDPEERILQWNCRSIRNKKSDLIYIINKYKPCVLSVSETWLAPNSDFRISGYICTRKDRQDARGGVAIFIKNDIAFSNLSISSRGDGFDAVAARIMDITMVSVYIPYPTKPILRNLISVLESLPKPLMVLGDLNCHHPVWGSDVTDSVGAFLLDSLDNLNLCLLNSGSPTRKRRPDEAVSAVDLSLCSPELASLSSWEVLSSSYGSDHFPILIQILNKFTRPTFISNPLLKFNLNVHSSLWDKFSNLSYEKVPNLSPISHDNINQCSSDITNTLVECAKLSFPLKKSPRKNIPSPPWWDKDCTEAIKARKTAELKYSSNMTKENYIDLNRIIAQTKRLLKTKKSNGWKNYCSSLNPNTPSCVLWQKIHRYRRSWIPPSSRCCPTQSWADSFMDSLAPAYSPSPSELPSSPRITSSDHLDKPFSFQEFKNVLNSVKDSAPGMDGIPYSFFTRASDVLLKYYLDLVNTIFDSGSVPDSWKSQFIIPILKPNKDPSDYKSYRPIALSSVLTKLAEHLIKNRLEWFLESNNLLAKSQYGFRKGKSTMDSLSIITTDIRLSFSRNESVVGAFLDITAAYDNVQLPLLRNKLHELRIPKKLSNFIMNLLTERFLFFRCCDPSVSSPRIIWRGLPQGSVLSPILYNLYTYDLETSIGYCRILQYADDILIYSSHKNIEIAVENIALSLDKLHLWMVNHGLQLSAGKSNVVVFTRKRTTPPIEIKINNSPIPIKDSVKFLGFILDRKLNGMDHCNHVILRCERNLNIIRCLSGVWWGAHPFVLKILYNAIIRSVLDYGTFLLEPANKASLRKLDLIQSKALRIISGAMKSTPINALQVECVDPPLYIRRQFLADRYFYRALQFLHHPIVPKLQLLDRLSLTSSYWRSKNDPLLVNSFRDFKLIKDPTFRFPNLPLFELDFDTVIFHPRIILDFGICKDDNKADELFRQIISREWRGWHTIFTDASKLSPLGCVGYGVFHAQYDIVQKIKSPPESSVFTGECLALLEAIKYILLFKLSRTVIFSDARSALQALLSNPFSSKNHNIIIFEIKKYIIECNTKGFEVVLAWIPGHSGITGNERVDQTAKDAVSCGDKVPFKNYCHDLSSLPKSRLLKSWSSCWRNSSKSKGSFYAKIQPEIPCKPWFSKFKMRKRFTSMIIRMRMNHCCIPVHLHKLHIKDSSICECGIDEGNLNHIFFSCPLLDHSKFFQSITQSKILLPTHVPELLSSRNPQIYKILVQFINSNNLKL